MSKHKTIIIGLTGPTGAGKSSLCAVLQTLGAHTIDADKIAAEMINQPDIQRRLSAAFGNVFDDNGTLNRRRLAEKVFSSEENVQKINAITHPAIIREIRSKIEVFKQSGATAVVLDAPLLFESKIDFCDCVIAVVSDPQVRLERIMERDGIDDVLASRRMRAQKENIYYTQKADYVIENNAGTTELEKEATAVFRKIMTEEM